MKIKKLISWDFMLAVVATIAAGFLLNTEIENSIVKDVYGIGVSVLSIVFSIFFAALSIIISSSDNDFVKFLEKDGSFTELIKTLRLTLVLLFISLIVAIILYIYTAFAQLNGKEQTKWLFLLFVFLSIYSLFAVLSSALDSIKFAYFRAKFLK